MSTKYITLAESNYKKLLKVIPCLNDKNTYSLDSYGKSQSSGFMDFNLDFINITDSYIDIAISHYFKQNGDSIPDPDMIVRVFIDQALVFPLTYQDQFGYNEITDNSSLSLKLSLSQFLSSWLTNLHTQHHIILTLSQ